MAEATPAEVLGWMRRLNRTPADAVDHFWPDADPDERRKIGQKVRQWVSRARRSEDPARAAAAPPPGYHVAPASSSNREAEAEVERPPADLETARLGRVEFLERQLAEVLADLAYVRAAGLVARPGLIGPMTAQMLELRTQLDQARQDSGRTVALERSPAAVADEVARRDKRIRELMARAAERGL